MIKYQSRSYNLFVLLIISLFMATVAYGQSGIPQGNIIKSISLQSENNKDYLVIQGLIQPDSVGKLTFKAVDKKLLVGIPNAIIDTEKLPTTFITFGADKPLENIQLDQKQEIQNEEMIYSVNMIIQARVKLKPYLKRPVTSSEIKLELVSVNQSQIAANTMGQTPQETNMTAMNSNMDIQPNEANVRMETQDIIQRFKKPSVMQVSILNASGFAKRAYKLSVYLGKIKKKVIEESLGLKLDIVNIANSRSDKYPQSTIYFRENFLKSALFLAGLIPGEQKVVPLKNQNEKIGVDIEIFLGKDYK